MATSKEEMIKAIESMSVLELAELVKALHDRIGDPEHEEVPRAEDLRDRAYGLHLPGHVVHPDRERRAPPALAADRPVDVVPEEVAHAPVADVLGLPPDLRVVGDDLVLLAARADERIVGYVQQGQ